MNKTKIKLGVTRTIKTAEFESLHILAEIEEVVEWSNEEERDRGIERVKDHYVSDFTKGYTAIVKSVGVQRSLAIGKLENKRTGETSTANVEADVGEVDIF
jgi:hypothetical protein